MSTLSGGQPRVCLSLKGQSGPSQPPPSLFFWVSAQEMEALLYVRSPEGQVGQMSSDTNADARSAGSQKYSTSIHMCLGNTLIDVNLLTQMQHLI